MLEDYSKHQQKIIKRYYNNIEQISAQRLAELVTELYLAETDAKRAKLWERVEKCMGQLKVAPKIAAHIMQKKDVKVLAENLKDWLAGDVRKK